MATRSAPELTSEQLHAMRYSVFRERAQTLDEAAAAYSIEELQANLDRIWSDIWAAVESAPEAAFGRQADDIDGGDVWSVGQVVSHLCDTQIRSQRFWEELLRQQLPDPPTIILDRQGVQLLAQSESLEALEALTFAWQDLMRRVPGNIDLALRSTHPAFGQAGPKGALLIYAVHMDDHLQQIRDLYEQ